MKKALLLIVMLIRWLKLKGTLYLYIQIHLNFEMGDTWSEVLT